MTAPRPTPEKASPVTGDDSTSAETRGSADLPEDVSGQGRLLRNVLTSWGAQAVFIVTGFVMPRLIDARLGQESLGVWDFSWSLIAYFTLVQGGVVSSINRYVAKHRAAGDIEGVNIVASSVTLILVGMAVVVAALTVAATFLIPIFFSSKLGSNLRDAQSVVFILGMSLALQVSRGVFGGILTGCHRWDLHHTVNAAVRILEASMMLVVVLAGGGLRGLALASFTSEALGVWVRIYYTRQVFPALRIRLSLTRLPVARNLMRFGGKTFLPVIGELVSNQTANLMIIGFLGPGALALFARPRNLIRQGQVLVYRYASVLTPTTSSLQASEGDEPVRRLLIDGSRHAGFMVLPLVAVLTIAGGPLMRLWMGPNYDDPWVPLVLALGAMPGLLQLPAWAILNGLNAHGRPGVIRLLSALVGIAGMWLALGPLHQGIVGAAVALSVPAAIEGVIILLYATSRLKIPLGSFCHDAYRRPLFVVLPLCAGLLLARLGLGKWPLWLTFFSVCAGMSGYFYSNWRWALSEELRQRIRLWVLGAANGSQL